MSGTEDVKPRRRLQKNNTNSRKRVLSEETDLDMGDISEDDDDESEYGIRTRGAKLEKKKQKQQSRH
jgi:hypothetical protein